MGSTGRGPRWVPRAGGVRWVPRAEECDGSHAEGPRRAAEGAPTPNNGLSNIFLKIIGLRRERGFERSPLSGRFENNKSLRNCRTLPNTPERSRGAREKSCSIPPRPPRALRVETCRLYGLPSPRNELQKKRPPRWVVVRTPTAKCRSTSTGQCQLLQLLHCFRQRFLSLAERKACVFLRCRRIRPIET